MRKIVYFMHTSLDGFVAGSKGEMDWINIDNEMFDYALQRTNEADIALYGRVTYEMMESYWPTAGDQPNASKHVEHSAWYNNVEKVIVSMSMRDLKLAKTKVISDNIIAEIKKLKSEIGKDILMFGSPSVGYLLTEENLIDDYWLLVNPILLGQGIPLFKNFKNRLKLKLLSSKSFSSGVICLHYENIK